MNNVMNHYDQLIMEGDNPFRDDKPLQEYMNKWDGQTFIDLLELSQSKRVLEIGVGTGRLAIRVLPFCKSFCGIDISPKTVERAQENLSNYNVELICDDFLRYSFDEQFDIIYSSLTFMHIKEKREAIQKVYDLLFEHGLFVLSIDKNQSNIIDMGDRKIQTYPDSRESIENHFWAVGFDGVSMMETEFAYIIKGKK